MMLTQEHNTSIDGKVVSHQHPITYISGLFQVSELNWAALTKMAYVIYMSVNKLSFYLAGVSITLRSDHLALKRFLQKTTSNVKVNKWSSELSDYNIKFKFIKGVKTHLLILYQG